MKLLEYQITSKRTMASLGDVKLDLCHCVLGMMSELEEYIQAVDNQDVINISEEITDVNFYLVNYMSFRGIEIKIEYTPKVKLDKQVLYNMLVLEISGLSDLVKKHIAYNKEIDIQKELLAVFRILITLSELYFAHDIDMEKSLQNNVDKLLIRFPLQEGFSTEKANNRDLESERKELSK